MRWVADWPFINSQRLEFSRTERTTLERAGALAEKAAAQFPPDSGSWLEFKSIATRIDDAINAVSARE